MPQHLICLRSIAVASLLATGIPLAFGADVNPGLLTQNEFRLLSEDLGAATSFKPLIPAEGLGITGFDIGIAVTGTKLQNRDVWEKAANGASVPSTLPVPTLRAHKGLPFDIDIGAMYSKVPSSNVSIFGGELRWAFLPGGTVTPAVAVRASMSAVNGVDHLSFHTTGLDVSISKGFLFWTPYAGVGMVKVKSTTDAPGLSDESFSENKIFAGVNMNFGLTNIALETDKTGKAMSYGIKLGLRFSSNAMNTPAPLSMKQVLLCGALIVTLSMGIRHGFGLWLQPITVERGWTRETFAFAIAIQNIAWGLAGPLAGMIADRWGAFRVLVVGGLLYALGLVLMALSTSGLAFTASAGVMLGIAQSGTTYAVVYGVIGRNIAPERRSWAMGVAAAAGSFGQFLMVPLENWLIGGVGWQNALIVLGGAALAILPLAWGLKEPPAPRPTGAQQSIGAALREAFGYRSFQWLMAGYFVCGFQVVFIGVHMPSYLRDHGLSPNVATTALALIGLFNVFGTYAAGTLGQRMPKRYILSSIYALRSLAIIAFLTLPLTPWSVYIFSSVMGVLWLSTVPPTNATVAQIFGVQYLSMLGGFVFLSHQIGSFLGVWLGGRLYDATGSYDIVWWIAVALGVAAALINLPVRETAITRLQAA